ncbi:F-box and leucine-rich protein 22 isoform X2 [Takifugu flavidus]|uniref:F-box and leucine-rich protein 22 isoform X2 n=1 Tax=Takifugu flavidus TaxID=433684 RepID=UPI002543FFA4|nr:F-box and leucine-rich protein 22 isoform X2 [Takifugu flavidus]
MTQVALCLPLLLSPLSRSQLLVISSHCRGFVGPEVLAGDITTFMETCPKFPVSSEENVPAERTAPADGPHQVPAQPLLSGNNRKLRLHLAQTHQTRCPNLLSLTLSGCGHVTDQDLVPVLQSCRKLRLLHLENCSRVTDGSLEGAARHVSLQRVTVDFCRNVTQAGLQAVRERRPEIQLSAVRSAEMIPDRKPEALAPIRSALQKVLLFS